MDLLYLALAVGFFRPYGCPRVRLRKTPEALMNILYLIALIAAVGVFAYLLAVLFYPEDFS